MVAVPVTPSRSVQVRPLGQERLRYSRARNFVDPAMIGAGQALGQAAEDFDEIQATYDEAAAKKLDNTAVERIRERLWTGDDAYFKKEGFDAVDARPVVEKSLADLREELMGQATTDRQRRMFGEVFDRRVGQELEGVARYSINQMQVEEDRQSLARLQNFGHDARTYADDPMRFAELVQGGLMEMRTQADKRGWSPERLQAAEEEFVSTTFAGVVVDKMARGDIEGASAFLNDNREAIDPETQAKLEGQLYQPMLERNAESWADEVLGIATLDLSTEPEASPVAEAGIPFEGKVTSGFGMRKHPVTGKQSMHKGVDIPMREGTPVQAPAPGKIIDAGMRGTAGNMVTIQHDDGTVTRYMHGSKIMKAGGRVEAGETIMLAGSTGRSTGPHLHYEVYQSAEALAAGRASDPSQRGPRTPDRTEARRLDLDTLLDRANAYADAHGLNFDQRKALEAEVVRRVGRNDQLLARQQADAYDEATRTMLTLGDNFTSVTQLGAAYHRLSPQQQVTVTSVAEANSKPKPVETDLMTWWGLKNMEATDPQRFARLDPFELAGRLSKEDMRTLISDQATIIGKDGNLTPKAVARSRLFKVSRDAMQAAGIDTGNDEIGRKEENVKKRLAFLDGMQAFADTWARDNPGKVPDDATIRRWAGTLLTQDNTERPLYAMPARQIVAGLSRDMRSQIEEALRRAGLPTSDQNIAQMYLRAARDRGFQ